MPGLEEMEDTTEDFEQDDQESAELLPDNNVLVVVVIFRKHLDDASGTASNNFVVTGWANYVWSQE